MSNTIFRSEVDPRILDEAIAVLAANGLTVSDVLDGLLSYIAERKRLPPLDLFVPEPEPGDGPDPGAPDYASLNFKELLAACPLDGIDLALTREHPRDIDV